MLYGSKYGSFESRLKITRVTEKQAFARVNDRYEMKFKREVNGTYAREIGGSQWGPTYYLQTDEIKAKWDDAISRQEFKALVSDSNKIPIEIIKGIIDIIKNSKHEKD